MWDLPRPGLEPVSPALAGGFLTTVPPGKPCVVIYIRHPSGFNCAAKIISTIWILKLERSARPEVVDEGILEEERCTSGLEGWMELREGQGEHSREENVQIVQKPALLFLRQ